MTNSPVDERRHLSCPFLSIVISSVIVDESKPSSVGRPGRVVAPLPRRPALASEHRRERESPPVRLWFFSLAPATR